MSQAAALPNSSPAKVFTFYALSVIGAIGGFVLICRYGQGLTAAAPAAGAAEATLKAAQDHALFHVLTALVAVIVAGRLIGWLFKHIGQPAVIGEVVAGILLGPSLLGWLYPDAYAALLPPSVAPHLGVIAQIAVILYMFLVGLEFDAAMLQKKGHVAVAISHASIITPFLLGGGLALWLYPRLSTSDVPFDVFALFLGVSMSVTAFPVLARILTDRGMTKTPLGVVALTCAAADDVTAWCLLAFVVAVAQAQVSSVFGIFALSLAYMATMFFVVRPILSRVAHSRYFGELNQGVLAVIFVALLVSALTTEWIGVHAIFGAFVLGAIVPHDSVIARELPDKLQNIIAVLFLPAFFAFTGMRTRIGLVSGMEAWLICGVIVLIATLGKFGGTLTAARVTGLGWRDSAALGALMNTRGLMELIVLNIGLDLGVISEKLFAMLVIMALVTTLSTTPTLHYIMGRDLTKEPQPSTI
ncbi:MAG: cation:proton antiporter [Planctomycetaceae bacterium]|nr:cation:proton antiporter [Planctomycetaceae bacterium]